MAPSKKICNKIDTCKIVVFDVMGGLLLRPYVHPNYRFKHLEAITNTPAPFFTRERIKAEKEIVKSYKNNVALLADIYKKISPKYKHIYPKEKYIEQHCVIPNPDVKAMYDYAKSKRKQIVMVYNGNLDIPEIRQVLTKHKYNKQSKIYHCGVASRTAREALFKQIAKDFDAPNKDIIYLTNIKNAKVKDIDIIDTGNIIDEFITKHPHLKQKNNSVGNSIILALNALHWKFHEKEKSYFYHIGYRYGGILAYGYARYIEQIAVHHNLEMLLFVARDGYSLKKVFETFNTKIKAKYVYAPRVLNILGYLDYNPKNKLEIQLISNHFGIPVNKVEQYITNNKEEMMKIFAPQRENFNKYLRKIIGRHKEIGIVDTNSIFLSSQKLISRIVDTFGIYWFIMNKQYTKQLKYNSAIKHTTPNNSNIWPLIEILLTSPEPPICWVNEKGKPVYSSKIAGHEKYKSEKYLEITHGIQDFANDVKKIFGFNNICISVNDIVNWLNAFIGNPSTLDKKQMRQIYLGYDQGHTK